MATRSSQAAVDRFLGELAKSFHLYGYIPVCALGVIGNVLSLWVWRAETAFNASILLFQVGLNLIFIFPGGLIVVFPPS
jgi:hypothetical protein